MANILLVASSQENHEDFELLANRLREGEHSACTMIWPDRNVSRLMQECSAKHLALVGITGTPEEIRTGVEAASVIANRCRTTVLAVCFDEPGFAFFAQSKDTPHANRIRFAVLVGQPTSFPHAKSLVRVGGKKISIEGDWSDDEIEKVVQIIGAEAVHKVFAA